jgi:hypothetical protein
VQRQLSSDYQKDVFLKDQLVAASDLPTISKSLREKPPKTAHEAQQRIAALLEDAPGSAGANYMMDTDGDAYFGLGKRYKGNALRRFSGEGHRQQGRNQKSVARIKGCWVCGKDHRAKEFRKPDEIDSALQKHRVSGAYLSAE